MNHHSFYKLLFRDLLNYSLLRSAAKIDPPFNVIHVAITSYRLNYDKLPSSLIPFIPLSFKIKSLILVQNSSYGCSFHIERASHYTIETKFECYVTNRKEYRRFQKKISKSYF